MKFYILLSVLILSHKTQAGVLIDRFASSRQIAVNCNTGICGAALSQKCDSLMLSSTKASTAVVFQVKVRVLDDPFEIQEFEKRVCSKDSVNAYEYFAPVVEAPFFGAFVLGVHAPFIHGPAMICGALVGSAVSVVYLLPRAIFKTTLGYAQIATTFESDLNRALLHLFNEEDNTELKISTALFNAIEEGIRKASIEEDGELNFNPLR